ncbi:MAG TPA: hypothetical protein DC054_13855 [Blastocatellia bacterium]|nr:hypothetical protein [Blastocatellia bacterium]
MNKRGSPPDSPLNTSPRRRSRFSVSNLPIRHRLPLLIGTLLFAIITGSIWASYRSVKESALEVGDERLRRLTQQLANQVQQSLPIFLNRTSTVANDPAVRNFLSAPSTTTQPAALSILQQFAPVQDTSSLQVELWNSAGSLVLTLPENSSPQPADLNLEFKQSGADPYKTVGPIRIVKNAIAYTVVAAVKDEQGKVLGYLVRWRGISPTPNGRKQLSDLLGSDAALYYGNTAGDIFTDLEKIVPKPPVGLASTLEVTHYARDGHSVMALGRPIVGTPWFVVVEFPDQVFLSQANKFLRRMVLIGSVLFVSGIAGSFLLTRNITGPLYSLTQATSAIGGGNYSPITTVRQNDELGELANAFNLMLVKVRDAQRQLEREITERTARLEAAPSAMLIVDDRGRMTLVNAQLERLFGYERAELLDQPVEMLVPERYRNVHSGHRANFFHSPSTRAMGAGRDLYGRRKDGSEVPIEIGLNPIRTDKGAFVLASIIDISERKRSEEVLRKSEERLHTITENLSEGLVISDLNGQLLHWNQTGMKMFGFSNMGEWLLKVPEFQNIFELTRLDGTVLKLEEWPLARVIAGQKPADGDVCVRRLDRDWKRVFNYGGGIVTEANGQALAFVTMTDVTEYRQAEEKLRRSQQQLAGIIGSAMDAVITVDDDQRIILFNAAAERMFLFPAEDAIGQPLDQFIPERFRATHKGHIDGFGKTQVTRRGMGALGALYGLRADGEEFPIEASISQIESDGRKLYTVILRDISERKRADEAIREQARILDLAPITIRDLKGRVLLWNTGAEQMYGWTSEEAVGKVAHELKHTKFPRPLEEIKARLLAHGHWEGEVTHTRKDGQQIVVASHWVLHRDEQGKPKAILEVNNDITERKQAEHEVRRLNEELEQRVADRTAQLQAANKELEAFSYSVSHDLRAPLRHIDGFSQALLEDNAEQLDEAGKQNLNEVRSASQEMARLIDDLLQLARVSRGEMHREEVNLSELAHSVIEELKTLNVKRNVTTEIKEGLVTSGDKRLLRVMLINLLGNAWKFSSHREQAEVTFSRDRQNGESFYFVRDNGAGFDMTYANKLFGAFQRLHTAGEFEGTGIGLATVQRIISRHGGRVWAEGAVNQGATFYFTLPNLRSE